jgi:hypothetical protein
MTDGLETRPIDVQRLRTHEARECDIKAKVARMLAAGREIHAHLREPITSDHGCLYDERGFPW